ncbi:hypothetical protein QUF54_02675 [Candidatus Marithioploca araucensis]|uniref:Uncharacterized protein n=1 Tax=Candidatus Marithioploca araucensis TaxID=70273 RepID=A0ABT7VRE6_9GAMM|nr:hypothetical protein [Candidatus Marithioploca araucensis]
MLKHKLSNILFAAKKPSFFSRSHALAWERIGDAPASRNPQDAGASRICSHAGASMPLS